MYTSHHLTARLKWPSRLFLAFVRKYCSLSVEGLRHIPPGGAFILASNHASHADTAVIYASLPLEMRDCIVAAAAQDYFFDRGYKQFVSRVLFNTIPVARKPKAGEDPLRHVVRALREDYGVLLYPEGTRSKDGEIGPFRSGIGRLVAEFPGVPVIPVLLQGTAQVMRKNGLLPRPHPVAVRYGAPLRHLRADPSRKTTWQQTAQEIRLAVLALGQASIGSL